ncbi:MAG: hypothetical protein ACI86H_003064 [bacterium]|jgi:hypothetical protein
MQFVGWEGRINNGEIPTLANVNKLAKTSKKIYFILKRNNLVEDVEF